MTFHLYLNCLFIPCRVMRNKQVTTWKMKTKKPELVIESVRTFADPKFGVDLFKLESPLTAQDVPGVDGEGADKAQALFDEMGQAAGRPWVMLSAGAGKEDFRRILTHAYKAGAAGYLAGRAIWLDAFQHFPDWDAIRNGLRNDAAPYMKTLNDLTDAQATPWFNHPNFIESGVDVAPADETFRAQYKSWS